MAVGRDRLISERAGVGNQPDLVRGLEVAAQDVIATLREGAPDRQLHRSAIELLECAIGALAEEPARLVVQFARFCLEVAAAKEQRAGGEQRAVFAVPIVLGEPYDESVV